MSDDDEHTVCVAVPVDLLRALIDFAYGFVVSDADVETVKEAEALLPRGDDA
jgi:hypothetical protein